MPWCGASAYTEIKVFEFAAVERRLDARFQLLGEFALFQNRRKDRLFARFEFAEVEELLLNRADLHFIQIARGFLTVTRDEGHRRAFVEHFDRGEQAFHGHLEQRRDMKKNIGV